MKPAEDLTSTGQLLAKLKGATLVIVDGLETWEQRNKVKVFCYTTVFCVYSVKVLEIDKSALHVKPTLMVKRHPSKRRKHHHCPVSNT